MLAARCWQRSSTRFATRELHHSAAARFPRGSGRGRNAFEPSNTGELEYDMDDLPDFHEDDATSAAHLILHQQKQILDYMRLIEKDGPRLQRFRKPFVPPKDSTPLIVRTISYAGEEHPATKKQVIVVAVSQLPLRSPDAVHKLKLLAGTRWSSKPSRDSGISYEEDKRLGEHGYIKISCEDFPEAAMNLKWGSDVLDNLLEEANNAQDTFSDIPHDQRHLDAKARKHRRGEHVRGRPGPRPSIKDFPEEWLPRVVQPPNSAAG